MSALWCGGAGGCSYEAGDIKMLCFKTFIVIDIYTCYRVARQYMEPGP